MENTNSSKKKKKGKDYVKKMAFLMGQDNIVKANVATFKKIKLVFENLVKNYPLITKRASKDKKTADNTVSIDDPDKNLGLSIFKDELSFGLNKAIRMIPKKSLSCLIVTDPITIQMKKCLHEMCREHQVPFILIPKLSEIKTVLNISSLSCIALTKKAQHPEAVCYGIYDALIEYIDKFNENTSNDPCTGSSRPSSITPELTKEMKSEPSLLEFTFDIPPIDELMIRADSADEYFNLKQLVPSTNIAKDIDMELIPITQTDNYFELPRRPYFDSYNFDFTPDLLPVTPSIGKNLAATLFEPEPIKIDSNSSKRLFNQPKIVHLPVSGKNKKSKKKFAKIATKKS